MPKIQNSQDSMKKTTTKEPSNEEHEIKRQKRANLLRIVEEIGIPERYQDFHSIKDYIAENDKQAYVRQSCLDFLYDKFETGLIFTGKNGTGKTMLACIILQEILLKTGHNSGKEYYCPNHRGLVIPSKFLYTEAIKIIRRIKHTWARDSTETEQQAINGFVRPDILIIDELGMQYGSPTETQFLTEIINDRYNQKKRTIISGNMTMTEMTKILGDRVIDRFRESGKVLVFDWQSYRDKKKGRGYESKNNKKRYRT